MKKIFTYLGLFLSVVLIGALTSCNPREIDQAVAAVKLEAMGIALDSLSDEQIAYMNAVE